MVNSHKPLAHQVNGSSAVLPRHVAIIMDGNGRWAERRGLPRHEGHRKGTANMRAVVRVFAQHQVPYVTLYAFSTENWSRPDSEVQRLMAILREVIDIEVPALHREGIQLRHLGRLNRLSPELREAIVRAIELTRNNTKLTLSVAFDYGGRDEILQAVKRLLTEGVSPDQVDEALLSRYLYTAELPDPDLVIRTGGEMRLSNFLLWQSAYSEYFHTPVLWPDFGEADVRMALQAFQSRQRRFGAISPSNSFV